ncbi:hypothetical protein KC945_00220 [Candidatus Saccharibacteria bacterium]|nr:hypothetical protein [Candidatus Saccharibacteria bacterium]
MEPFRAQIEQVPQLTPQEQSQSPAEIGSSQGNSEARTGFINRNEATERRLGHLVEASAQQPFVPSTSMALPVPVVADDQQQASTLPQTAAPLVAADEDLIEKEWVDKAKQVIADTKDEPYLREQEVKKLQIEYVQKRYGKIIGARDEQ